MSIDNTCKVVRGGLGIPGIPRRPFTRAIPDRNDLIRFERSIFGKKENLSFEGSGFDSPIGLLSKASIRTLNDRIDELDQVREKNLNGRP